MRGGRIEHKVSLQKLVNARHIQVTAGCVFSILILSKYT